MSAIPSQSSSRTEKSSDSSGEAFSDATLRSNRSYLVCKRCLDITLAFTMFLLSLPFALLIALLIKCESRGPVLFVNRAVGQYGRTFLLYKFRSMRIRERSEAEMT